MSGILEGIKVIDVSQVEAIPMSAGHIIMKTSPYLSSIFSEGQGDKYSESYVLHNGVNGIVLIEHDMGV